MNTVSSSHSRTEKATLGRGSSRTLHKLNYLLVILLFLTPAAILYSIFVMAPVVQATYYSLFTWNGFTPLTDFIGFDNYARALGNPVFRSGLWHTFLLILLSLFFVLPTALGLALLVGRHLKGRTIFRVIFFLPFVLSEVLAAAIWNFMYQPQYGAVNSLLKAVIPGFQAQTWLGDSRLVLFAIIVVGGWKYLGYHMTLFITGLTQISPEIEESAAIDGATGLQTLRYVTLPMMAGTIRLNIYLSVLGTLQTFEMIFVMTAGGPAHASETVTTYLYNYGFKSNQLGYGSAIAMILFSICFLFSLIYQRFAFSRDFEGAVTARG